MILILSSIKAFPYPLLLSTLPWYERRNNMHIMKDAINKYGIFFLLSIQYLKFYPN